MMQADAKGSFALTVNAPAINDKRPRNRETFLLTFNNLT